MTWRSTAVVSGAGLLATWLASAPHSSLQTPSTRVSPASRASEQTSMTGADIQREADRLRVRLRAAPDFHQPSRNPFRFAARVRVAPAPRAAAPTITDEPMAPAPPEPPTLRIALSGIATDTVGDQVIRTAIVSTPSDVLLVKEGDQIAGQYKVVKIAVDAIELLRLDDGTTVRLALRP